MVIVFDAVDMLCHKVVVCLTPSDLEPTLDVALGGFGGYRGVFGGEEGGRGQSEMGLCGILVTCQP